MLSQNATNTDAGSVGSSFKICIWQMAGSAPSNYNSIAGIGHFSISFFNRWPESGLTASKMLFQDRGSDCQWDVWHLMATSWLLSESCSHRWSHDLQGPGLTHGSFPMKVYLVSKYKLDELSVLLNYQSPHGGNCNGDNTRQRICPAEKINRWTYVSK